MAGVTSDAVHVFGGDDLWEAPGLGCVLFVAAPAKSGDFRQQWLRRARILSMLRLRPVARLAGHVRVPAGGPDLGFVVMTGNAGVLAGEGYRPLADALQRARAIVTILAERLGDYRLAHEQKQAHGGDENRHQPQ